MNLSMLSTSIVTFDQVLTVLFDICPITFVAILELIRGRLSVPLVAGGIGELVAVAGGEVVEDSGASRS